MLTEDAVVDAVAGHLEREGWSVESRVLAVQQGDDLVVTRAGRRMLVEAKGEGSSKPGTRRYGQAFDRGQVHDHVAKAVLRAMRAVSAGDVGAVALPDNADHRREVERVAPALGRLGVVVYWVSAQGVVRAQGDAATQG